jgi:DNA-directed RNA polymerase subunit RPC12/RpoP
MAVLCSNCAGRLIFNPATQKLECATCGSSFRPEDVEDVNAEVHSKYYDTRVYVCSHCGAEVITSDSESSTFCVYCGNPAIVFDRISKEYKPDGLIPFKITKETAIENIKKRFAKNPIVPKELKSKCVPENLRGIYVPYWVINADFTEADYLSGEVKRGKRTETKYYTRAGEVELTNVPIDGSKILSDDVSRKLEPFYLEDSRTFDEDYLNGFYSNTSDMNYFDLKKSAANRCHELFAEDVVKTVKAQNVKIRDSIYWVDIHDDPIYMMMPVWFFTFKFQNKPYTILVNGQTGKVVGTMPWQKKRIVAISVLTFLFVMAAAAISLLGLGKSWEALSTVFTYILAGLTALGAYTSTRGIVGLKRINKNLKLTQSEDIFRYVKKRQG